jgi:hypothetical protein
MPREDSMIDETLWDPDNEAIWREEVPEENRAITLRHPTYPFPGQWNMTNPGDLLSIAAAYLRKVVGKFGLRLDLLEETGFRFTAPPPFEIPLTWLPIGLEANIPGPLASVWVRRYRDLAGTPPPALADRTAILLAVQSLVVNQPRTALGSRLGIRVVAHVSASGEVRITGSTCSSDLPGSADPHIDNFSGFFNDFFSREEAGAAFVAELRAAIAKAAGLDEGEKPFFDGVRVRRPKDGEPGFIEVYSNVLRPADQPAALAYALTTKIVSFLPPSVEVLDKTPLVAHASPVTARLFLRDPASQTAPDELVDARPNRSPKRDLPFPSLEQFRHSVTLPGLTLGGSGSATLLDGDFGQVEVTQSKLLDPGADESLPETVADPANVKHARMNPFAALSAYWHGRELFDTMRGYGLDPAEYFRLATFPLLLRYRATITPGPGKDGKTVNAQVDYDPPGSDLWDPTQPRPVQVRFALADLKRSASRREPLGLATDPRWSWHEYSHVLLAASTGALELRFAHSAGDALAAIRWDPVSELVSEPPAVPPQFPPLPDDPERPPHPRVRMATFPWVYLNRRHDRSVYAGWSWCGTYHRPLRFGSGGGLRRRKGYQSEQILSTSLFRLYRALGGDTVDNLGEPDQAARRFASDYTVYLIMRAMAWLGPLSGVPAETPDQFVSALIDADVGTTSALWAGPAPLGRVGGCAHKVVRWAFEAQGLYASPDPTAIVDAPGKPPDIDVFIDNGRPDSEGSQPRGGYMPVSLDWSVLPNPSRWHATGHGVVIDSTGVTVRVGNRGQLPATGVVVRVSHSPLWLPSDPPPAWDSAAWTPLGSPSATTTVPPGGEVTFGPFTGFPTPAGRYLILAEATCPGDLANTDSTTPLLPLPCSVQPTPIVDLVAGDNNLGLGVLDVP